MRNAILFLLMPLPLFLPYVWLDHTVFWANPDSIFYLNIYTSYRDALWASEWFPHWIASSNYGLGSLAFYALSPLAYTITALVSAPLMLPDMYQYLFGIYASQLFGAWAMWRFLRLSCERRTALLGAAVFTLVPYKFTMMYQHYNLAQCWALAFLPLWFHAAQKKRLNAYAVAGALVFYAHPLTVLSAGPLALLYVIYRAEWPWRSIIKTHILMLMLVSPYLGAMLTAVHWTKWQHWNDENYTSLNNLYHIDDFTSLYGPMLVYVCYRCRLLLPKTEARFWGVSLLALYVVATPLSYPLWAYMPGTDIFQFPFARLQPCMAVATALLAAALFTKGHKEYNAAIAGILALFTGLTLLHIAMVYQRPRDLSMDVQQLAMQYHILPSDVYLPRWTQETPNHLLQQHETYKDLPPVTVIDGSASISDYRPDNHFLSFRALVHSATAELVVSRFYAPLWSAADNGEKRTIAPYPDGRMKLTLPQGEHEVRIILRRSFYQSAGNIFALIALLICCLPYRKKLL